MIRARLRYSCRLVGLVTPLVGGARVGCAQVVPVLTEQVSGTRTVLQSVSPVSATIAWVGGHAGAVLRTTNGGRSWERRVVPDGDSLQFRDVHAVSADTAYVLSAGSGERSRIYKTMDGGRSWSLQFLNRDSLAFYDCFDFWDADRGIAFSDAVGGRLPVLRTVNGGASWDLLPHAAGPAALQQEGGFAASGTCILVGPAGRVWMGTGAGGDGRVHRSTDGGLTWTVAAVPFTHGSGLSGVATLAFRDSVRGVAMGGNLAAPEDTSRNVAYTRDGGRSWTAGARPPFAGGVYGSGFARGAVLVAVGPKGMAYSRDDGRTWTAVSAASYWAVAFAENGAGWAVGPDGRITRIDWSGSDPAR